MRLPWDEPTFTAFDVHIPLMSLAYLLNIELENLPNEIYMPIKPQNKLPLTQAGKKKVGLVWSGNKNHSNDNMRSCPLSYFEPLMKLNSFEFYSLQKTDISVADLNFLGHWKINNLQDQLLDFYETAKLIAELDFIITVDTAIAHLAGAMGKKVFLLLPYAADWRWLLGRDDSPWYTSMRLLRQNKPGDWTLVFNKLLEFLAESESSYIKRDCGDIDAKCI